MTKKLTLSVDKDVIQKAKRYARQHHKSLSKIVANYLGHLTGSKEYQTELDPEVVEVSDEILIEDVPKIKELKFQYLKDKYLHD